MTLPLRRRRDRYRLRARQLRVVVTNGAARRPARRWMALIMSVACIVVFGLCAWLGSRP